MRAARQALARSVGEVKAFLDDWNPPSPWKAVVKPLDSAGSDDVFLVESREEAVRSFEIIDGKVRVAGDLSMCVCVCVLFSYLASTAPTD